MMAAALLLLSPSLLADDAAGFARMEGEFEGPMFFYDLREEKRKEFPISLRLLPFVDGASLAFKYRYAPEQYQYSVAVASVSADGTKLFSRSAAETIEFQLTNWREFCAGAPWFEIQRNRADGDMRFRYTITKEGFVSDKSLRRGPNAEWEFSHQMKLKRVSPWLGK